MQKKLFRAALISSPILAIVGNMPLFLLDKIQFPEILYLFIGLTILIFVFWITNIWVINKFKNPTIIKRYLLSFGLILLLHVINLFLLQLLGLPDFIKDGYFFPLIPVLGINSLILILSNSIIFQYQKQTADLEIEQLKVINLEAQKQVLSQQLQPHFLFNTLSTLKSLISENPSNAEDYTVRLSEFLRYSIKSNDQETVTLGQEIKFSTDYVGLQKVRFGDSFDCMIDIAEIDMNRMVPVYAIQTLIENAIKHNAFNSKKPLKINIEKVGEYIKISNNVLEKTKNEASGLGLKNLSLRYKMIANADIEIFKDEKIFSVTIPLI